MSDTAQHDAAFEALQRFAAVWHAKYAHANGGGNRKPPSLTMRAGGDAAALTEPQLQVVVAEYVRMRRKQSEQRLLAAVFKANRNVPTLAMQHLREAVQHLLKLQESGAATVGVEAMLDILNPLGIADPDVEQSVRKATAEELHRRCLHPDYEYATTEGPRKSWDGYDDPPEGDGWERNVDAGRPGEGWERFNYHEESYWRRLRASVPQQRDRDGVDGHE